jgi:uncharacterized repeat protein (TIGR02543 family)
MSAVLVSLASTPAGASSPTVVTVSIVDQGCSTWLVPAGVSSVEVNAVGAAGASSGAVGGKGDGEAATISGLTPDQTSFDICVDEGGGAGGGSVSDGGAGGAGGGASGVSLGDTFASPLVVAGGGGGGGGADSCIGRCGGSDGVGGDAGTTGTTVTGISEQGIGGGGADLVNLGAGGAGGGNGDGGNGGNPGASTTSAGPGVGGSGGTSSNDSGGGGGGGGGYNGGGGGGATGNGFGGAGGGGGADFCGNTYAGATSVSACTLTAHAGTGAVADGSSGAPQVTITYTPTDTVSFNSEGGSAVTAISGLDGTSTTLPSAPTYPGYSFDGWFAAASGGSALNSSYTFAGSVILYAQWTWIPRIAITTTYTDMVSLNAEGGSVEATITGANGSSVSLPIPAFADHTFLGWFTSSDGGTLVPSPLMLTVLSTTLYAQWSTNPVAPISPPKPPQTHQVIGVIRPFTLGSSVLTPALKNQTQRLAALIEARHVAEVDIRGNATLPDSASNMDLASARASVVETYLKQLGVRAVFKIEVTVSGSTALYRAVRVSAK